MALEIGFQRRIELTKDRYHDGTEAGDEEAENGNSELGDISTGAEPRKKSFALPKVVRTIHHEDIAE